FVALCFRGMPGWFRRSWKGNFIIQTASYVLLFGWYWLASGTSLYTRMHVVRADQLSLPESVLIYFISDQDGNVYERPLAGTESHMIFRLNSTNANERLLVKPSTTLSNFWDLFARLESKDESNPTLTPIKSGFAQYSVADERANLNPPQYPETWFNFGNTPRLGSAAKSDWDFETGFWPIEGMHGTNSVTHDQIYFSFETPFAAWTIRNATHLPGDNVLFQLGTDQICLLDPT